MTYFSQRDPDILQAIEVIKGTYGDTVSVLAKQKNLNKFGQTTGVGTTFKTVMSFQGSETLLTYPSTNLVDTVVSTATGDTSKTYTVEGHSIDGNGDMTFVAQDVTTDASNGQTPVSLTTPLRNVTRAFLKNSGTFNSPQTVHTGIISFYDNTDGQSSGVPTTASAVSLRLLAGETQSAKAATSLSSQDYWILTGISFAIEDTTPTANYVEFNMYIRDVRNGGVFRPLGRDFVAFPDVDQPNRVEFKPYRIVPKNHDWEIRAKTDTGTADVYAEGEGYLAIVT